MTAPSVLTFIALADELNRVMSVLQSIANGSVGDAMEHAQKALEITADAFSPTHMRVGTVDNMHPAEQVHKIGDGWQTDRDHPAGILSTIYRDAHGVMQCMPRQLFLEQFIGIPK
jgi:hypothetical protein